MTDLTTTEIVTFVCTVAGVLLIWALSRALSPRQPTIKAPVYFWSCGCACKPVISDAPLMRRA